MVCVSQPTATIEAQPAQPAHRVTVRQDTAQHSTALHWCSTAVTTNTGSIPVLGNIGALILLPGVTTAVVSMRVPLMRLLILYCSYHNLEGQTPQQHVVT